MKNPDPERDLYDSEFSRYSELQTKNLLNQDTIFVQLSVGLLAALVTLGKSVLTANKALGFITVVALSLTILQVLAGYYASNIFFIKAKAKLTKNYQDGSRPINKDLDKIWTGRLNNVLNHTQYITFVIAMISFIALVLLYVGKNDGQPIQQTQQTITHSQRWPRHYRHNFHTSPAP